MNRLLLTLTLVALQGMAWAQNTQSYICLNLGPSLPMGDYAATDITNEKSNFAKIGPEFSLEGVYFFIDYIGIGGKTGLNVQGFNKQAYTESAIDKLGATNVDFYTASPYFNLHSVAGLYLNAPITEKFHITPKILGGVMMSVQSETEGYIEYTNKRDDYFYREISGTVDFAYMLAVDFRYIVTEHFMIKVNVERLASKHTFSNDFTTEYKYQMLSFSISAGLAF